MSEPLHERILEALRDQPSQKADQIAHKLGASRTDINRQLYGPLKDLVIQDRTYKWSLAEVDTERRPATDHDHGQDYANTDLSRLCRYYLACLGYDDAGVSTFLTSKYGDPDYIEIAALPSTPDEFADTDIGRNLLGRKRSERGRYGLYFGYPTSLHLLQSRRSSWEGLMVEPLLLFPIDQQQGSGRLTVDLSFPIVNQKPFQQFTNADRDMLMNELVQLEQELGVGGDNDRLDIDEVAMRLQAIRPEWPWREDIDPEGLAEDRLPISAITEPGVYNRAVVLMAEKSPFTQGLERELRELTQLSADRYADTALGRWLTESEPNNALVQDLDEPLIEVLPMNLEQRQAVAASLTRPVTVITGPPGTGKSQVVTNLLINAAWQGKRVLFASKNNKAVDVVETRVNALGSRPILLRVGAQAYQVRLAEYVLALISATTTESDQEEFEEAKTIHENLLREHQSLTDDAQDLIDLRNKIDGLEQEAESARQFLGPDLFSRATDLDLNSLRDSVASLGSAIDRADPTKSSSLVRALWPLFRAGRYREVANKIGAAKSDFDKVDVNLQIPPSPADGLGTVSAVVQTAADKVDALEKSASYLTGLAQLQESGSLEEIAREEAGLLDRIARHSAQIWKLWLRIQPAKLSAQERQSLGKYTALLRMVIDAGEEGQLSRQAYGQYTRMLRQISYLLPCWAVTSLSARGRIPFEPATFDIVIFDESSQCDIASALPLMYRAKSVVVIGDPNQLSHISSLHRGQDRALLEKFDLMEDFPHWAYSHQSLFGLAATQVAGGDVVSLVDHHRSHADIISFSNDEFYEERLRVATRYDLLKRPNPAQPGIRWVDVKGQASRPSAGGALNQTEANSVVATLRDLILDKGYEGTVGVVTPFRAQANSITELVNQDSGLVSALLQKGFLADTVHKFQGDERDVMIFSPVVSEGLPNGPLGFLRSNGNLFNVAITRARAQLIVVGDLAACGACDIGYLSRFAEYSSSLGQHRSDDVQSQLQETGPTYPTVARPELVSDWERGFYVEAYQQGFRLLPQYPIEKYIVDFLLVDDDRKLVIEIDGERYHRNWTGELCRRDQLRNQRLFELGYDVVRFWVYEVRDDLRGCLDRLRVWQAGEKPRH